MGMELLSRLESCFQLLPGCGCSPGAARKRRRRAPNRAQLAPAITRLASLSRCPSYISPGDLAFPRQNRLLWLAGAQLWLALVRADLWSRQKFLPDGVKTEDATRPERMCSLLLVHVNCGDERRLSEVLPVCAVTGSDVVGIV
jgi:hypothetical protein